MTIPTKEMVLMAGNIVGIVRRYGTEDLSSINVLLDHDTGFTFECEEKKWHSWNADSYWDLYESEYMLTVMRSFSPEKAVEILEDMNAFMSSVN